MEKISIITVVYNGEKFIANAIQSVLNQDYPNIEHIIVDGKSTDSTAAIVRSYSSQIAHFISEKDEGIYDAMNKGIRAASGSIIGILNADDIYAHNNVITMIANTFRKKECAAVYGDLVYVSAKHENKVIRYWKAGNCANNMRKFEEGWMPPHPTFFVRKSVYDTLGYFNTRMRNSADYELMLRFLYIHQISTAYLSDILVKMRVGGISNANLLSRLRANLEDRKAWEVNQIKPKFYTLFAKPFLKISQYFKKPNYQELLPSA